MYFSISAAAGKEKDMRTLVAYSRGNLHASLTNEMHVVTPMPAARCCSLHDGVISANSIASLVNEHSTFSRLPEN
jgi:hypothetical protein